MTEGQALYQSILEHPEDDAPRLIYSDWLEEQGDSQRAAFIRAQCELARAEAYSPLFRKLTARSKKLFQPHWLQTLRGKVLHSDMRRGFIHKVTIYSKRFVTDGGDIFDTEPVREVKFAEFSAVRGNVPIATLAVCPHLGRLTGLNLGGNTVTGRMMVELLDGGHLRGLRKLHIDNTRIESEFMSGILNSSRLPRLEELEFSVQGDMVRAWLGGRADLNLLRQLRSLTVHNTPESPSVMTDFLQIPALASLEKLVMIAHPAAYNASASGHLPDLSAINQSSHLGNLKELDLSMANVQDASFRSFVANPRFHKLRRLSLPMNRITDAGVQAILGAEHLRGLYYLNLDTNPIRDKSRWKELLRKWCPEAAVRMG